MQSLTYYDKNSTMLFLSAKPNVPVGQNTIELSSHSSNKVYGLNRTVFDNETFPFQFGKKFKINLEIQSSFWIVSLIFK